MSGALLMPLCNLHLVHETQGLLKRLGGSLRTVGSSEALAFRKVLDYLPKHRLSWILFAPWK